MFSKNKNTRKPYETHKTLQQMSLIILGLSVLS